MTNLQKISILCAAVLTMGLTACGETAENSDSKDNTAVTTTTTAAETTTTAAPVDDSVAETTTTTADIKDKSEIENEYSEDKEDIEENNKPIIKKKTIYSAAPKNNISEILDYDEHGNVITDKFYTQADSKEQQEECQLITYDYQYNDKDQVIQKTETTQDLLGKGESKTQIFQYEYYDNGLVSKEIYINPKDMTEIYHDTFEYDGSLLKVQVSYIPNQGEEKIYQTTKYEYDEHGNQTTKTVLNNNNEIISTSLSEETNYEYDDNGNIIRYEKINDDNNIYSIAEFEYDENNNQTIQRYYSMTEDNNFDITIGNTNYIVSEYKVDYEYYD